MAADFFTRISGFFERLRSAQRAFVLGPGVVEPFESAFGHPTDTFSPEEYGNALATSGAVYTCATLRAGMLCGLPVKPYKLVKGKKTEVTSGQLYSLLQKVNPFWTMRRLVEMTELSLCMWGKNFWFLERGESGRQTPREIWWGKPDRVRVVTDAEKYVTKFLYYPIHGAEPLEFDPWEVVWMRYANPLDEFEGLAPYAAARLAADLRSSALKSNKKLFDQGMQLGGAVFPKQGATLQPEQAAEIEHTLDKRYKGVEKAHRWAVFRYEFDMKEFGINARDAEFVSTINLTLEEVARAYHIPLDFIGGQRTYENVEASERAIWQRCLQPEALFLADELTEQLAPMFPGEADLLEMDLSGVEALHESEDAEWDRASGQIERGAITINEWREQEGKDPVAWGDVWWRQSALVATESAEMPEPQPVKEGEESPAIPAPAGEMSQGDEKSQRGIMTRAAVVFGSDEHQRVWKRFERRADGKEQRVARAAAELFRAQRDSILARMKTGRMARGTEDEPFDRAEWVKRFRERMRPVIREIVEEAGGEAIDDLVGDGILAKMAFQVTEGAVKRFIEQRAQRFAERVNETTWDLLRKGLAESIEKGEGLLEQMARVEAIMAERIRSSSEVIARTEVVGAMNGGTKEAWRQSGVVEGKGWLGMLDQRIRDSHAEAHARYQAGPIGLDEEFEVGNARGQAPGQMGDPDEDIQCRCTMTAVVREMK